MEKQITDCEIDIDDLDNILNAEYSVEVLKEKMKEAEKDGYPTGWYIGMIEQLESEKEN